ncbi:MAG TPA: redoxin domain-containing protein [Spirochaetota bacterium]|nr:redoxin domain-containing protein [Spirochaetota bacterium]HPJ33695.1 redoxin domain-containing protein [Spirochaetota bacterium]
MKRFYLVLTCIIFFIYGAVNNAGTSIISKRGTTRPDTIIGRKVYLPVLTAFHKGEIKEIDLKDYRGKWMILFFYPADFTFVCPTELKELSDYYSDFTGAGAEIFAISTDSAYVHRAWQKDNVLLKNVKFPMLSDRSGSFSRAMGVYESSKGTAIRASFIVDPDGVVVAAEYSHESIGRNSGELLRKLDAAIAVRKGGGGFCPAGWTEGSELIHNK